MVHWQATRARSLGQLTCVAWTAQAPLDALTGYATLNDLDQKASIADVNEGLKHKANKSVVRAERGARAGHTR